MECVTTAADAVGSAAGGAPAVLLNTYKSFFLQGKYFVSYYTFLTETCRCSLSGLQQNVSAFFASIKMAVSV